MRKLSFALAVALLLAACRGRGESTATVRAAGNHNPPS
jgi:hypothetical protein